MKEQTRQVLATIDDPFERGRLLREAFLLRHELGHSYEEIAEIAATSVSAAKMRVARAREALREALDPDFGDVTGAGLQSS